MWHKRTLGAITALGLIIAACGTGQPTGTNGGGEQSSAPAAVDQVLRVPLGGEPATLDPQLASDSVSITVLTQLVRPLVYFDADLNTVSEGGLADSWEISEDGQTVTFHLKDGIKYSDGSDSSCMRRAVSGSRLSANCRSQSKS